MTTRWQAGLAMKDLGWADRDRRWQIDDIRL
jgi:hypothetical protein